MPPPPPPPPFLRSRAHIFKCRLSFKRLPYYPTARIRLFQNRQCITLSQMNEGTVSKETVVFRWGSECRSASAGRLSRSWRFRENRFALTKGQRLKTLASVAGGISRWVLKLFWRWSREKKPQGQDTAGLFLGYANVSFVISLPWPIYFYYQLT